MASIFTGLTANSRYAIEIHRMTATPPRSFGSCHVRATVYRLSGEQPALLNIYGGCAEHWMTPEDRTCGSYCHGGTESWTYVDEFTASYCDGYDWDNGGCVDGCREEEQCYNDQSPGCY